MKDFQLPNLIIILTHLKDASELFRAMETTTISNMKKKDIDDVNDLLDRVMKYCTATGFDHARNKAYTLTVRLRKLSLSTQARDLAVHLEAINEDVELCMFSHRFLQIESDLVRYLDAKKLFGGIVVAAFPSSQPDIQDAGNCISVDLHAAAVFHLMHVVEWGMRALASDVGLADVILDKKTGKTIPVEYSQWEQILNQLQPKIDAKLTAMPRSEEKQELQEFYYTSLAELRGFKDAWRNHIMHTRTTYNREDTLSVWSHVERFMKTLASHGLKE